jgi:DNA-3-methyladenine glycosylase
MILVSRLGGETVSGRIIETEAYLGYDDPASHAWRGRRNKQNEGIYSPAGYWYVYLSYGMHWCANLVCGLPGNGSAVLLRGLLPLEGIETIRLRRAGRRGTGVPDRSLADGPGKLTQALGITRALDRQPMASSGVVVAEGLGVPDQALEVTPRIGISRAVELPLRFVTREGSGHRVA